MHALDWMVLVFYFVVMAVIGFIAMLRIKRQEDYFMGGRGFGKLLQTFAAFGAGTGSGDPINVASGAFSSGMCGMWRIMSWLFATPFYWIIAIWFRRMRHMTTGDFFVERYRSQSLGAAYAVFGVGYYIIYVAFLFSAINKFVVPLVKTDTLSLFGQIIPIDFVILPIVAMIVIAYGVLGGLKAAYWTDLIQGMCIILLSILLIPFGLNALVEKFPELAGNNPTMIDGFRVLHERVPEAMFSLTGSTFASEFPIYRIAAFAVISLVGIVVYPHLIAVGGGSAKTETDARVGLVTGNFFKRFCTIAWTITGLIVLALYADNLTLQADPDLAWGFASQNLFEFLPGLTGLMFACLLAALMSSVDCYMLVGSALVVRNIYTPYVDPKASDAKGLLMGRLTGVLIIGGAVLAALTSKNVLALYELSLIWPMVFAAVFWVGIYWRRATTTAAWGTVAFGVIVFFILPFAVPRILPGLRTSLAATQTSDIVVTQVTRDVMAMDVDRREIRIQQWHDAVKDLGMTVSEVIAAVEQHREKIAAWEGKEVVDIAYEVVAKTLGTPLLLERIKKGPIGAVVLGGKSSMKFKPAQTATDDDPELPARMISKDAIAARIVDFLKTQVILRDSHIDPSDVEDLLGPEPVPLVQGELFQTPPSVTGGKGVFWTKGVKAVEPVVKNDDDGIAVITYVPLSVVSLTQIGEPTKKGDIVETVYRYSDHIRMKGQGNLRFDLWPYSWFGMDLSVLSPAMLATLELPPKIIVPFVVMILLSLITRPVDKRALDRFYVKMKTPVSPDPEQDKKEMEASYADPTRFDHRKLLPGTNLEIQKPTALDIIGFVVSFIICFGVIGCAVMIAGFKGF